MARRHRVSWRAETMMSTNRSALNRERCAIVTALAARGA
jgi:hypothetical protein